MAQVSLGEVLSSPDARAYSAINSKRVDLLIVSRSGDPIAAIEYQGHGHYQGTAAARDAVKKEALRKAGATPRDGSRRPTIKWWRPLALVHANPARRWTGCCR